MHKAEEHINHNMCLTVLTLLQTTKDKKTLLIGMHCLKKQAGLGFLYFPPETT